MSEGTTITLSAEVAARLRAKAAEAGFDSPQDFLEALLVHREIEVLSPALEDRIWENMQSGPPEPVDANWWRARREMLD